MRGRLVTNLGVALASVAIAGLLGELSLRIFVPQDRSVWAHTDDGLVVHPPGIETYLPSFGRVVRTNAWGMRDRPHALEKPAGTFRILVLGDSFMEALQVDFEDSLPALLERELAERGHRQVEVINASTSDWGTDDEVAYLARYGRAFQPDLVLVAMTLHNDVSDNLAFEHHELRGGEVVERRPPTPSAPRWAMIRTRDLLATRSHLYQIYRRLKAARRTRMAADRLPEHVASLLRREPSERVSFGWGVTCQLLVRARELADESGARMAVFTIPLRVQLSDAALADFLDHQGLARDAVRIDEPQAQVADCGNRVGVETIDLLPGFRSSTQPVGGFFVADGHWNREGHALGAEIVARELFARGLVEDKTP